MSTFTHDWATIDETNEVIYLSVSGDYLPFEGDNEENNFSAQFLGLYNGYYINGYGDTDILELTRDGDSDSNADTGIYISHAQIDLGGGNDLISITNSTTEYNAYLSLYVASLNLGNGNDVIEIESTVGATQGAGYYQYDGTQAHLGAGNDEISVTADGAKAVLSMYYGAKLSLGNGDDSINLEGHGGYGLEVGSGAFINFGKGDDEVTSINTQDEALGMYYGAKINFGKGDDTSYISGGDGAEIYASVIHYGKGDDIATFINQGLGDGEESLSMYSGSVIDMGEGDNQLIIINEGGEDDAGGDSLQMWYGSSIIFEDGDDYLYSKAPGFALSMSSSSIIMGDGDDEIVFEQTIPHPEWNTTGVWTSSSLFDLGEGNDSITADINQRDGWYAWATTIRFGEGNDTWEVNNNWTYDPLRGNSYANTFNDCNFFMGNGDDNLVFTNTGGLGLYLSSSTLLMEDGDDSVISDGTDGWAATWISRSTVDFGDGDDVFSTIYENIFKTNDSWALSMWGATVSMGDGEDVLTVETSNNVDGTGLTGIYLHNGLIDMGKDDDTITVTGDNDYSIIIKEGSIDLGEGNNDLYAEGNYSYLEYTTILSGDGQDDIELYSSEYHEWYYSAINTGGGNDVLTLTGDGADYGLHMSSSSILTGYGTDTVTITGDIYSHSSADWPDNVIDLGAGRRDVLVMDWLYDADSSKGGDLVVNGGQGAGDILVIADGEYQVSFEGAYLAFQLTSAVEDSEGGIYTDEQKLLTMGFERLGYNRLKFNTLEDGDIITVLDGEASINDELLA